MKPKPWEGLSTTENGIGYMRNMSTEEVVNEIYKVLGDIEIRTAMDIAIGITKQFTDRKIIAVSYCRRCHEPAVFSLDTIAEMYKRYEEEIKSMVKNHLEGDAFTDGWRYGYCPECLARNKNRMPKYEYKVGNHHMPAFTKEYAMMRAVMYTVGTSDKYVPIYRRRFIADRVKSDDRKFKEHITGGGWELIHRVRKVRSCDRINKTRKEMEKKWMW